MLYTWHEAMYTALAPWRWWAKTMNEMMSYPFSPYHYLPASRQVQAGIYPEIRDFIRAAAGNTSR